MITHPVEIDQNRLILEKNIPTGCSGRVVIISYNGKSLAVPMEMYEDERYRVEFIKKFGFPPPVKKEVVEVFSPNIKEML